MRFPLDYTESRQRFCQQAEDCGWTVSRHNIDARGPGGESLSLDTATSPNRDATFAVVVSSGLHGVEAPLGAAVQERVLSQVETLAAKHPNVRFVLLHALNPWGWAWSRRVNEDNVDPNRNFLLAENGSRASATAYRGSDKTYATLEGLLNPKHPPRRFDLFYVRAALAVARHGMSALKQAIAAGQYDFCRGLFFGGRGPIQTQRILAEHLPRWLAGMQRVVHLDYHTGLGRWGTYKLLLDSPLSGPQRDRLAKRFGATNFEECSSDGVAYRARGGIGPFCIARSGVPDYLYLCAEFGAYPPLTTLAALRAENRAHHFGDPQSPNTVRAKARLREVFCPQSIAWRRQTLQAATELVAAAALAAADA